MMKQTKTLSFQLVWVSPRWFSLRQLLQLVKLCLKMLKLCQLTPWAVTSSVPPTPTAPRTPSKYAYLHQCQQILQTILYTPVSPAKECSWYIARVIINPNQHRHMLTQTVQFFSDECLEVSSAEPGLDNCLLHVNHAITRTARTCSHRGTKLWQYVQRAKP